MAKVSFICKRTVISTKPVEPDKYIPLSVLDQVMEHNNLRAVFYYQLAPGKMAGELTRKLHESLSEMLSAFPIAIGRLLRTSEGQWMIKCNDAGLRIIEARAQGSVEEWLQNVDGEKELELIHWEEMYHKPYFWATFYFQVTEFEGGGVAIGLSCSHLLSDPVCATMMIKAWADITLGGKMITPPLFHPLPPRRPAIRKINHKNNSHLINHYKSALQNPASVSMTKQKTIALLFNQEKVRSCIEMAGTSVTPFEALAALFWTRISKVKGTTSSLVDMSICLDMRKVLDLDKFFFGNCMVYNKVKGDGLKDHELSKAAIAVKDVVSEMDYDGVMDLIEWLEQENSENPPCMNGNQLVCVGLENVDLYSAVFEGNASPVHASYYIEPAVGLGQVVIFPSPKGQGSFGRVVMITLPQGEAEKLLDDELILQLAPSVLMGLNKKHP